MIVARTASAVAMLLGAVVLVGWATNLEWIKNPPVDAQPVEEQPLTH